MLKLNLIRHGKTEQQSFSGTDFDRNLLPKGKHQSESLGNYLRIHEIELGSVYCSNANRAVGTFQCLKQDLAIGKETISEAFYLANLSELTHHIALFDTSIVTIIGHNEGLSDLASYLLNEFVHLRTAEWIQIQFNLTDWNHVIRGSGIRMDQFHPMISED
jgi:phosphohistidine phosphatase